MDVVICETCTKAIPALDRYCAYCGAWQLGQVEAALSQEYSRRLLAKKLVSEDPSVSCRLLRPGRGGRDSVWSCPGGLPWTSRPTTLPISPA